ncbi:histidine kinase [Streptomyces sp. TLI_185]|uniref:sensor histidine kinase n=1 Tax=Streptomyces sp. TLI_185 TaxID=2485151 RepID=UPI000F5008B5|nr:histidine kinase [Streptomyces sp. TLI_185]RPF39229.1 histidine kinase/DNA gyrase B/HSP90-like ATPase [Streptomyces sp. TLI_185]
MSAATEAHDQAPPTVREAGAALVALVVAALVGYGWYLGFHLENVHNGLIGASFTAVGLYVVRMRPRHPEGWLFVATGVLHAVMFFGRQYGLHSGTLVAASWLGWVGVWPLPLAIALAGWTFMAFPDGRLPSPLWRPALVVMFAVAAVLAVVSALWPVEYDRMGLAAPHPLNVPGGEAADRVWKYAQYSYLLFQVLWTAAIVVRIRRARGDEVRQMRWLVFAVVAAIVLLVAGLLAFGSPVPGLLALPLIPVAAGFAILKFRLYDIDPVINKSLVVGAMLLLITAAYVAIVVGAGAVVPADERMLTLLTTAVVAVAFEPLRRRAQRLADRLVYGHRATPYEALSRLSAHLENPPQDLLDAIAATVAGAVGATEVVVWVGDEHCLVPQGHWPAATVDAGSAALAALGGPRRLVRLIVHRGTVRGAITVRKPAGESLNATEVRLLADLVAQTGLIIVQQQQVQEIQAAARRIVTAEDAARRRIERDLHDGAQQRLVTLGLELGALAKQAEADGAAMADRVKQARAQLLEATAELRELARGLHPMVLAQSGLEPALAALADRSAIPVRLRLADAGRLPRDVEATAYYVVSEALTNAARYSGASVVVVDVAPVDSGLCVEVTDDGCGGARPGTGTGLQGLADRLAALGGDLQVDSPSGGGTRIRAVLPCE